MERLSKAAELKRMTRAAVMVTRQTVAQAEELAAKWWEAQGVAFVVDSTRRGTAHLERSSRDYKPRVGEVPRATCRAMASREVTACQALPEQEAVGCQAWLALHAATRPDVSCDTAPEPLREACTVLRAPETPCTTEACSRVLAARSGLAEACTAPDDETRCTWAGLLSSLAPGGGPCDAVRPGGDRRSPRARRTHALCRAVLAGQPLRCPEDTVPVQVVDVATWIEARVIKGREGLRLVTNLQVDRPAACAVEVELRRAADGQGPGGEVVIETLRWTASPGSRVSVPDWRELESTGSAWDLRPVASATCVQRVRWRRP